MKRRKPVPLATKGLILAGVVLLIIFAGAALFNWLEPDNDYVDAIYSVIMIMTGIGSTTDPKTTAGKTFNMLLAIVSVGILVSVLGQMFRYFSTRSVRDVLNAIHDRKVRVMKNHPIICGSSFTLHELLHQMEHCDQAWIIVRTDAEAKRLEVEGYHAHVDDYTTAAAMRRAGIDTAGCVIACGENDADNAFVTLTAKHVRKDIPVIVRLTRSEHREKLRDAGADEIVVPAELAAMQIRDAILGRVKRLEG